MYYCFTFVVKIYWGGMFLVFPLYEPLRLPTDFQLNILFSFQNNSAHWHSLAFVVVIHKEPYQILCYVVRERGTNIKT